MACSTPPCLECCAVWIFSFYELCLLLPRQGQFDKWIRTERERKAELQKQEEIPDEHKAADCCSRVVGIYTLVLNPSKQGKALSPLHPITVGLGFTLLNEKLSLPHVLKINKLESFVKLTLHSHWLKLSFYFNPETLLFLTFLFERNFKMYTS